MWDSGKQIRLGHSEVFVNKECSSQNKDNDKETLYELGTITYKNEDDFESPIDFLMENDEILVNENIETDKVPKCPYLNLKTGNVTISALIDTGSPCTCISNEWYIKNKNNIKVLSEIPVQAVSVMGAFGGKAQRIRKQIFLEIWLNNIILKINCLVIPKLINDLIIGVDTLMRIKGKLNFENCTLEILHNNVPSILTLSDHCKLTNNFES